MTVAAVAATSSSSSIDSTATYVPARDYSSSRSLAIVASSAAASSMPHVTVHYVSPLPSETVKAVEGTNEC